MPRHHIVLVPGLFGFAKLGGFDYFTHVEEALASRFMERGADCEFVLVSSPPTGSIVHRTQVLMDAIRAGLLRRCGRDSSRWALDRWPRRAPSRIADRLARPARLVRPGSNRHQHRDAALWNAARVLLHDHGRDSAARGAFPAHVLTLRAGGPPLTVLTPLIAALGRVDRALGLESQGARDDDGSASAASSRKRGRPRCGSGSMGSAATRARSFSSRQSRWTSSMQGVEDNPNLRYGCVVTRMPPPAPGATHSWPSLADPGLVRCALLDALRRRRAHVADLPAAEPLAGGASVRRAGARARARQYAERRPGPDRQHDLGRRPMGRDG